MTRRRLISLLGGLVAASVAQPFVARAEKTRRIGVLTNLRSNDPEGQNRVTAFVQALQKFGWAEGSIHTDVRFTGDDADLSRRYAEELVALAPDVLLASGSLSVAAFQRVTRSVPIVFALIIDPIGAGFVSSLAHPGGNTTGLTAFEYSSSGKWLELLKKLAPQMTRVAVLRDPTIASGIGQFAAIQFAASSFSGIELSVIDPRDANEIERAIATFGREPNGGIITTAGPSAAANRKLIISLFRRYRLPDIYPFRYYPADGGLASYGPDPVNSFKRAAEYVDRILKGAKPSELPVQTPTKYELVLNLKAAKALGLEVPTSLLTTADEVIE